MEESTMKTIQKSLHFVGSGETLTVKISLENVPPRMGAEVLTSFLDNLFEDAKKAIFQ